MVPALTATILFLVVNPPEILPILASVPVGEAVEASYCCSLSRPLPARWLVRGQADCGIGRKLAVDDLRRDALVSEDVVDEELRQIGLFVPVAISPSFT